MHCATGFQKRLAVSLLSGACLVALACPGVAQTINLDSAFASASTTYAIPSGATLLGVGDVTVMRPLTVAASSFSTNETGSAIIDTGGSNSLEFASISDPAGNGSIRVLGPGTVVFDNGTASSLAIDCLFTYYCAYTGAKSTVVIGNGGTTGSLARLVYNNGDLVINRSDTYVYSGYIVGNSSGMAFHNSGSLRIASGTFVVIGSANNSRGTTIDPGATLQIGDGVTTGSVTSHDQNGPPGSFVNNGTLVFDNPAPASGSSNNIISDNITGSGDVRQTGSGTTTLSGNNSYNGRTYVSAGTLVLEAGTYSLDKFTVSSGATLTINTTTDWNNQIAQLSGNLATAGTVLFAPFRPPYNVDYSRDSTPYLFPYAISGSGALSTTGYLILTGTNTYTGGSTVDGNGTLQIGNGGAAGSIVGDIVDNAAVVFDRSDNYIYSGVISGMGEVQYTGSGTLNLTGNNTYTGATRILSGTLQIGSGGTTGAVAGDIRTDATLVFNRSDDYTFGGFIGGTGTVTKAGAGALTLNGTVRNDGGISLAAGTLVIGDKDHTGATLSSSLTVANGTTLKGFGTINNTVTNSAGGTVKPGGSIGTLTIGSYTQSGTGVLDIEVSPTASSLLRVSGAASLGGVLKLDYENGSYGPQTYTFLTANSITGKFSSISENGRADVTVAALAYTPVAVTITLMPKRPAELFSDLAANNFDIAERFNDKVFAHLGNGYCRENGMGLGTEAECPEVQFWTHAYGGRSRIDGNAGSDGYDTRYVGGVAGIDAHLDLGLTLGVVAGYEHNTLDVDSSNGHITTDTLAFAGNATLPLLTGRLDVNGMVLLNRGVTRRQVDPANASGETAAAHANNTMYGAAVQYSRTVITDDLTALAKFAYATSTQSAFTETGAAPFDLTKAETSPSALYADVGLKLSHIFTLKSGAILVPELSAGVRQHFGSQAYKAPVAIADVQSDAFSVSSPSVGSTDLLFSAGVTAVKAQHFGLYLRGDGRANGSRREGTLTGGVKVDF